jgi:hypothetical protein
MTGAAWLAAITVAAGCLGFAVGWLAVSLPKGWWRR